MRLSNQRTVVVLLALGFALLAEDASAQGLFKRLRERIGNAASGRAPDATASPAPSLPARPYPQSQSGDTETDASDDLPSAGYRIPPGNRSPDAEMSRPPRTANQFGGSVLSPLRDANDERNRGDASIGISGVAANPGYPGVRVTEIYSHSEAEAAGLRVGDYIFALNRKPTPDVPALAAEVSRRAPGDEVSLRVGRDGKVFEVDVPLVASPVARVSADRPIIEASRDAGTLRTPLPPPTQNMDRRLGAEVTDLPGRRGVLVESTNPAGSASRAGLAVGDQIIAINGDLVSDSIALRRLLATSEGDAIEARVIRGGRLVNVPIRFDEQPPQTMTSPAPSVDSGTSEETTAAQSNVADIGSLLGNFFGGTSEADAPTPEVDTEPAKPLDLELPLPEKASEEDVSKEVLRSEIDALKE
ncbi:MAG: PDZ domain-containing protein [Planctomycetota bacterium]